MDHGIVSTARVADSTQTPSERLEQVPFLSADDVYSMSRFQVAEHHTMVTGMYNDLVDTHNTMLDDYERHTRALRDIIDQQTSLIARYHRATRDLIETSRMDTSEQLRELQAQSERLLARVRRH